MKKLALLLCMFTLFLVACNEPTEEVITTVGLTDETFYLGEVTTYDWMEGITFSSSTRGDITSLVIVMDEELVDFADLGVYIVNYKVLYENGDEYQEDRRIVVLNEPDSDNLIVNGDFSETPSFGVHAHATYPSNVNYIIDPDLLRLQVIIFSVTDNVEWPHISFPEMTLDSTKTYTFSALVSGTVASTFHADIVETTGTNEVYEVTAVLVNPELINVGLDTNGMLLVSFTFTPTASSTTAKLRLCFGSGTTGEHHLFIDNVHIEEQD